MRRARGEEDEEEDAAAASRRDAMASIGLGSRLSSIQPTSRMGGDWRGMFSNF